MVRNFGSAGARRQENYHHQGLGKVTPSPQSEIKAAMKLVDIYLAGYVATVGTYGRDQLQGIEMQDSNYNDNSNDNNFK